MMMMMIIMFEESCNHFKNVLSIQTEYGNGRGDAQRAHGSCSQTAALRYPTHPHSGGVRTRVGLNEFSSEVSAVTSQIRE